MMKVLEVIHDQYYLLFKDVAGQKTLQHIKGSSHQLCHIGMASIIMMMA